MSTHLEDCIRMRNMADAKGIKLTVAHYRRAMPMFIRIKQMLEEGLIGDVRTIRLSMLQPLQSPIIAPSETYWRVDPKVGGMGGLFYDLAPHQLDLMVYFFGPAEYSTGLSANQAGAYQARDIVSGLIRFKNDIIFSGTWCFTVEKELAEDRCEIIGSHGKISFPLFGNVIHVQIGSAMEEIIFERPAHVQQAMIEKVVQYFSGTGTNPCSADDAIESMKLMEKFVQ